MINKYENINDLLVQLQSEINELFLDKNRKINNIILIELKLEIDDEENFMDKLEVIKCFFFLIKNQINSSKK